MKQKRSNMSVLRYFSKNLAVVVGIVLIWRGVWLLLDAFENRVLGGHSLWTIVGGILIGLLILYLPDRDLKELERL
ncbi:MAG: hypothetical protein ABI747_04585 [Candidatus Moraniibacteriota bacterium]